MSRRKQSNPKPFKRLSDDEDDESDMKSTESSKSGNEPSSPKQESNETTVNTIIKSEPASPDVQTDIPGETIQDEIQPVIFLNDVLLLKKIEKDEAQQMGRSFLVCAAIPLPKGSSIGPFDAEIVSLSSIRQGDLVLQAQDEQGETSFIRVDDPCASWLTMLRPAPSESVRNASVLYQGGQIWCEIISELNFGAELLSSFTIQETVKSEPCSPDSTGIKEKEEEDVDMDLKSEVKNSPSFEPTSPVANSNVVNHAALLYGCPFCGVRFSSARTLEGHLTYYCSKKPSNAEREAAKHEQRGNTELSRNPSEPSEETEQGERSHNDSNEEQSEPEMNENKVLKGGELFHCPSCSYTSDKLSSLNRHKRIHTRGSNSPTSSTSSNSPVSKQESYCGECNIQFSSYSTFKCHKDYYCSKRIGGPEERTLETDLRSPRDFPISFPEQMSPVSAKNLKHIVNASSALPGQTNVILGPPIVARGMLNIPFGMPTVIVQPVVPPVSAAISPGHVTSPKSKKNEATFDQPLDLSISKRIKEPDDSDKENSPRSSSSNSRGSVKLDSSTAASPPVESPRQQREQINSTHSGEKTPSPIPTNRISPFITVPPVQFISGKPIPPVPHSVSKCIDCNIVFYKHENYIIHKKHYCSSRQTRTESRGQIEGDMNDVSTVTLPLKRPPSQEEQISPKRNLAMSTGSKSPPKQDVREASETTDEELLETKHPSRSNSPNEDLPSQFFCGHCKIRFSSTSTLVAHKEFYCPYAREGQHSPKSPIDNKTSKPNIAEENAVKCRRCNAVFPSTKILNLHFCTGSTTHVPLLRCPYCDYVTQTENRISEHLKVHMPSKAYRCTICGYRGNTVRGMRMHGKMHIDNGEEFSDENMVEIEEPPLVPILFNSPNDTSAPNVEAELIRLKNEPYKRRRSRKSYEKSEHMINLREPTTKLVCVFCGQPFNDNANLAMHIRIHEMVAYHATSSRNLKCHFCEHVAESFPSLMVHVEKKHLKDINLDKNNVSRNSPKRASSDSENEMASPNHIRKDSPSLETAQRSSVCKNDMNEQHNAERERTLNMLNLSSKIKTEPKDDENESVSSYGSTQTDERQGKKRKLLETIEEKSSHPNGGTPEKKLLNEGSPENKPIYDDIKHERSDITDRSPPPLRSPLLSPEFARYYQLAMQVMPPLIVPRVPSRPLPSPTEHSEKTGAKYCKYCDISFTYLSTYVAHKKYYCTARQPEEMTSPAKA